MFLKSDIQSDNALELKEIIEWVDQNQTAKELFLRYGKPPPPPPSQKLIILYHFSKEP